MTDIGLGHLTPARIGLLLVTTATVFSKATGREIAVGLRTITTGITTGTATIVNMIGIEIGTIVNMIGTGTGTGVRSTPHVGPARSVTFAKDWNFP